MGDGVRQSARANLARAEKLKKALQAGAPPSFVPAELSSGSVPCAEISCSINEDCQAKNRTEKT